ncbi:putative DNA-binding protein YlxM (UPF0122 family) [Clostridium algifaecis]|uniref:DNA-binding protein YlxM (UPF0122 family) n=1 Tax=Clostridium algifaecis TaxID=1472040 RepID=A0ABS4KRD1_9CLOT|nr:hypothetical protein [Clostridium algifaecis]MBP2032597.1 putative DNA-binding protein YlxM (UPF0122 family) [Clostridium algifaecis]
MNSQARDNIHKVKESLKNAQQCLQMASGEVENSNIKKQINTQLTQVTTSLGECERIASGLSQHKSH